MSPNTGRWRWALALAALVVLADQAAKSAIVTALDPGESAGVIPGVELSPTTNSGIAFGLFGGDEIVVLVVTLVALAVLAAYFVRSANHPSLWIPVALLAGGALGNLADRVRDGVVLDYIDLPHWPAFNLADVAITAGVALLVIDLLRSPGAGPEP